MDASRVEQPLHAAILPEHAVQGRTDHMTRRVEPRRQGVGVDDEQLRRMRAGHALGDGLA